MDGTGKGLWGRFLGPDSISMTIDGRFRGGVMLIIRIGCRWASVIKYRLLAVPSLVDRNFHLSTSDRSSSGPIRTKQAADRHVGRSIAGCIVRQGSVFTARCQANIRVLLSICFVENTFRSLCLSVVCLSVALCIVEKRCKIGL